LLAHAAACCGGGFAAPALLVGDDAAQITAAYSYTEIVQDVGTDSFWRPRSVTEASHTLKIEGAQLLSDQWQAGLSVPVVRRSRGNSSSAGLGDIAGTVGYEYLPDWDYNPYRPRGLGFFQLTFPTGRSINEANTTYQLDSRGRGFWALGLGTILTKAWGRWDAFTDFDIHRSFRKEFVNAQAAAILHPGWGGNASLGAGFNLTNWRFGLALSYAYEDPISASGSVNSVGAFQRYSTANVSVTYLTGPWAVIASYADQTLFGSPINTSLGRGLTITVQKKWAR
jgi:hypothetical protein